MFKPARDEAAPAASEVSLVVVYHLYVRKMGLEGAAGAVPIVEYLVAGAMVMGHAFIQLLRQTVTQRTLPTLSMVRAQVPMFFENGELCRGCGQPGCVGPP